MFLVLGQTTKQIQDFQLKNKKKYLSKPIISAGKLFVRHVIWHWVEVIEEVTHCFRK